MFWKGEKKKYSHQLINKKNQNWKMGIKNDTSCKLHDASHEPDCSLENTAQLLNHAPF